MSVINYLDDINKIKLNNENLAEKIKPIKANNNILKVHRYYLNNINQLPKKTSLASPFDLFSKKAPTRNDSFKISLSTSSDLNDKVTRLGYRDHSIDPMQSYINALSIPQIKEALSEKIKGAGESVPFEKISSKNFHFSSEIVGVINQNNDFVTLRIKRPKEMDFQPGQYLEIRSEGSSLKKSAILAIASGKDDDYLEITGKPNSNPDSPYFCLNSQVGDKLIINGPLGSHFPFELITPKTPVTILGGGSGLTALKSLMESLPFNTEKKMIYSAKSYSDLIYKKEIEKWKLEGNIISLTQDKIEGFGEGRISQYLKKDELKPNSFYFLCGPDELVIDTAKLLVEMGIPRESIYGSLAVTAKDGGPVFRGDHPRMIAV